jgi:opacity protein-like surface antigen
MKKALLLGCLVLLAPALASAQIRQVSSSASDGNQTVNFTIGYFSLKGLDSRVTDDVLLNELTNPGLVNDIPQPLLFQIKDFNGATFSGEYLIGFGRNLEAGVGVGYYQRTVPSVYANLTHSNGDEIAQDLKLRTVPFTFTARFLPLPRGSAVEPYVGAGLVVIKYRFSETGEFVDEFGGIYSARYSTGLPDDTHGHTAVGPTVLGGVRFPVGNIVFGGEGRWQKAEGKDLLADGFLGDKIDLGGWVWNFTAGVRF